MYAKVENGEVVELMQKLPKHHTFANGNRTGNFDIIDTATQVAEGYYPVEDVRPNYNPNTQSLLFARYDIEAAVVKRVYQSANIPLADAKAAKIGDINDLLETKLLNSQFTYGGEVFNFTPSTASEASELRAALSAGMPFPSGFSWTQANGKEMPMDEASFTAFGLTVAGHKLTLVGTAKAHVANVSALTTVAAVADYDESAGW